MAFNSINHEPCADLDGRRLAIPVADLARATRPELVELKVHSVLTICHKIRNKVSGN